jgi:hypothetical protein
VHLLTCSSMQTPAGRRRRRRYLSRLGAWVLPPLAFASAGPPPGETIPAGIPPATDRDVSGDLIYLPPPPFAGKERRGRQTRQPAATAQPADRDTDGGGEQSGGGTLPPKSPAGRWSGALVGVWGMSQAWPPPPLPVRAGQSGGGPALLVGGCLHGEFSHGPSHRALLAQPPPWRQSVSNNGEGSSSVAVHARDGSPTRRRWSGGRRRAIRLLCSL